MICENNFVSKFAKFVSNPKTLFQYFLSSESNLCFESKGKVGKKYCF